MGEFAVRDANVLVGGEWRRADVEIADGVITAVNDSDHVGVDGTELLLAPGFVDLQVNGLAGIDLTSEPERVGDVARALVRHGVTAFCPTVITSPPGRIERGAATAAACAGMTAGGARLLGWHAEGPMLHPLRRGAHPGEHLRAPAADVVEGWSAASGVALVTLAPELDGAAAVIEQLRHGGVVVFAGHTAATATQFRAALDSGVRGLTHLFNAMPGLGHREPGPIGVAFTDERVVAGIIADGVHIDPAVVKIAWHAMGPRLFLVSDAVGVAGCAPGVYTLGGASLVSDGTSVRLRDGTLAGSVLTLDVAVRNLVAFTGCSVADALQAASSVPARVIGAHGLGRIEVGCAADLVLLNASLQVVRTIVNGVTVFDA